MLNKIKEVFSEENLEKAKAYAAAKWVVVKAWLCSKLDCSK